MDGVEYIKSNKGGVKIIYRGYMYTVHKNKKCGGIRWRCAQRSQNCKGSMTTSKSGTPFINMHHNHLPDHQSAEIARHKFEDNLFGHFMHNLPLLKIQTDSMPLEQRLKAPPEQEPVLQSQPLSPTKLKVTRQSSKPPQPSPKPITPEPPNEEVCLRWNSHHSNMQTSFPSLLLKEQYVDATLVAEGQSLRCHRLILSSCSPYFEEVLSGISPFQHPVLFMKDIPFWVLKSLCDFMYAGEVHIFQNKLEELLAVAESLKIKGLAGKTESSKEEPKTVEPPAKPLKEEKKEEKEKEVEKKKRSSQHSESTPKTTSKAVRSTQSSKKTEKASKESLSKEGILDPLDLLEPVYEEVTKEAPPKLKEIKNIAVKKGKLKKRKFSEGREESPPPLFLSRKGTRSRPHVKMPKYYHTHYERVSDGNDATIVREPHTDQPDPLLQIEEIKAEPLDLDDDVIEIEDNVIGYPDVPEIAPHDEEIIGNYDSPLVNLSSVGDKREKGGNHAAFKKINLIAQPIIMNIHSITEKSPSALQIVDVMQLQSGGETLEKTSDPLDDKATDDPLNFIDTSVEKPAGITITNVQSVAEVEEPEKDVIIVDTTQIQQIEACSEKDHGAVPERQAQKEASCQLHVEGKGNEGMTEKTTEIEVSSQCPMEIVAEVEKGSEETNKRPPENEANCQLGTEIEAEEKGSENMNEGQTRNEIGRHIPMEVETEVEKDGEQTNKQQAESDTSCQIRIEKVVSENDDAVIETPEIHEADASLEERGEIAAEISYEEVQRVIMGEKKSDIQDGEISKAVESEAENVSSEATVPIEENEAMQVEFIEDKAKNDVESEEPAVELGFHIAKVASEQFSVNIPSENDAKNVISEDCAGELGFQITNVVSGQVDSVNDAGGSDLGAISNHLSEMEGDVEERVDSSCAQPRESGVLSEDAQFLAESLEKLLE